MELHDVQKSGIPDNDTGAVLSPCEVCIEKIFFFYRLRFHFIAIPIGIILAAIHLKFAIQYLGQCTIQPMINIYMILNASLILFTILLTFTNVFIVRYSYPRSKTETHKRIARYAVLMIVVFALILHLFSFAWVIAGSVWIFGAESNGAQGSNPDDAATYCPSDLLKAAVTLMIVHYVIHGVIILGVIAFIIRRCIRRKRQLTVLPPASPANRS